MRGLDHEETVAQPPAKHDYHAVPIELAIGPSPVRTADLAGFVQTPSALTPDRLSRGRPAVSVVDETHWGPEVGDTS